MLVHHALPLADELAWLGAQADEPAPAAPKRKNGAPERAVQRAIVAYIRQVCPGAIVAAITNEERGRGKTALARARFGAARRRSGVVTGMPDVLVLLPGGRTLLIEVKAPGGVLSEAQAAVHGRIRSAGHTVGVAVCVDSARRVLLDAGAVLAEAAGQPAPVAKVRTVKARSRGRPFALPVDKLPPGFRP